MLSHCKQCHAEWDKQRRADHATHAARIAGWRRRNPDKERVIKTTRRARERAAFVEKVDHQVLWERDEGICGICGKPADRETFQIDHIIPLSKNGKHTYNNTQVSHPSCNARKNNRLNSALEQRYGRR